MRFSQIAFFSLCSTGIRVYERPNRNRSHRQFVFRYGFLYGCPHPQPLPHR